MWMWQSQAPGGAASCGRPLPAEFGTARAPSGCGAAALIALCSCGDRSSAFGRNLHLLDFVRNDKRRDHVRGEKLMSDAPSELTVSLWRGDEQGRYQSYRVPLRASQTVLDVVTYVQRHLDPTLAYRFACRVGVCGSCAMTVNGRPRWTCRTHVSKVSKGGRIEIGPLENLPMIRDLATDMRPFFEKWQQAEGSFVPSKTRHDPIETIAPGSAARMAADGAIECIHW